VIRSAGYRTEKLVHAAQCDYQSTRLRRRLRSAAGIAAIWLVRGCVFSGTAVSGIGAEHAAQWLEYWSAHWRQRHCTGAPCCTAMLAEQLRIADPA